MRFIDPFMSPEAVAHVDSLLSCVRQAEGVHLPWAIESGSRAWGFPSPDSDYDCRFLYVRPADQVLSLWPRRDVIETPLVGDMDVNGWDLAKALRLLLKGNAVVVEWLTSPIVYSGDPVFRDEVLAFAGRWLDRDRVAAHYLHLGRRQDVLHLAGQADAPLKKLFYVLRPAAALRWLRLHPDRAVAPMHFPTLLAEGALSAEVTDTVDRLIAQKAVTREMGAAPPPAVLMEFARNEFGLADGWITEPGSPSNEARAAADALFRSITRRLDAEAV